MRGAGRLLSEWVAVRTRRLVLQQKVGLGQARHRLRMLAEGLEAWYDACGLHATQLLPQVALRLARVRQAAALGRWHAHVLHKQHLAYMAKRAARIWLRKLLLGFREGGYEVRAPPARPAGVWAAVIEPSADGDSMGSE